MSTTPDNDTTKPYVRTANTPGPWKSDRMGCFVFALDGQFAVCETRGWGYLTGFEGRTEENATAIQKANAHLISAAPDLLEALTNLRDLARVSSPRLLHQYHAAIEVANAAIAKAEGR